MSDGKGEPTPTTPTREAPRPDSLLTERLLSRGTDSLGLIDVRRTEQHYARIMEWLAERTPLLEHLRTRYGLTEGEGSTGLVFAEAMGLEGAHASDVGVSLSAAPVSFNAPAAAAAEQIFTRVAHIPDDSAEEQTEAKRIARRGVPTFSSASPATGPGAGASRGRSEVVSQESGEVFKPALEPAGANQEQPRGLQSPPPVKEIPAATVETSVRRPADAAQESTTSPPTRRAIPSVEERVAASAAEQEKPLARGRTGTNAAAVNDSTDANEPSGAAKPRAPRVTESPAPDALPPVPPTRAPAGVSERERVTGSVVMKEKLPVAGETRAASVPAEMPRPLAQAREIRGGDSGHASASLHTQPPLPLATSHAGGERAEPSRRQNDSAPAVTRASSGAAETFTPGRARARARADEVNVPRLTEQVSRHLARRLLVERERRGWSRK